jgi:ATP-dependent exoDNAse (exonuclease V) alpha subunit
VGTLFAKSLKAEDNTKNKGNWQQPGTKHAYYKRPHVVQEKNDNGYKGLFDPICQLRVLMTLLHVRFLRPSDG